MIINVFLGSKKDKNFMTFSGRFSRISGQKGPQFAMDILWLSGICCSLIYVKYIKSIGSATI